MFDEIKLLIRGWNEGDWKVRTVIAVTLITLGFNSFVFTSQLMDKGVLKPGGILSLRIGMFAAAILVGICAGQEQKEEKRQKKILSDAEEEIKKNPEKTKPYWDLARKSLEVYINDNQKRLKKINFIIWFVMFVGFGFICTGIAIVYNDPEHLSPALIASISGVVVNFIGATFLVVYKSIMKQAAEYVSMLERINAVGMSIHITQELKGGSELRETSTADIAKQLLELYK